MITHFPYKIHVVKPMQEFFIRSAYTSLFDHVASKYSILSVGDNLQKCTTKGIEKYDKAIQRH